MPHFIGLLFWYLSSVLKVQKFVTHTVRTHETKLLFVPQSSRGIRCCPGKTRFGVEFEALLRPKSRSNRLHALHRQWAQYPLRTPSHPHPPSAPRHPRALCPIRVRVQVFCPSPHRVLFLEPRWWTNELVQKASQKSHSPLLSLFSSAPVSPGQRCSQRFAGDYNQLQSRPIRTPPMNRLRPCTVWGPKSITLSSVDFID